jgi:hypothetical protein
VGRDERGTIENVITSAKQIRAGLFALKKHGEE